MQGAGGFFQYTLSEGQPQYQHAVDGIIIVVMALSPQLPAARFYQKSPLERFRDSIVLSIQWTNHIAYNA